MRTRSYFFPSILGLGLARLSNPNVLTRRWDFYTHGGDYPELGREESRDVGVGLGNDGFDTLWSAFDRAIDDRYRRPVVARERSGLKRAGAPLMHPGATPAGVTGREMGEPAVVGGEGLLGSVRRDVSVRNGRHRTERVVPAFAANKQFRVPSFELIT